MKTDIHLGSYIVQIHRKRNVLEKIVEKFRTHILYSIFENHAVYEIIWKNREEPGRTPMEIRRTRIACWIHKATDTHSQYVIRIAFPLKNWMHECA
jgi:hypothetical protein